MYIQVRDYSVSHLPPAIWLLSARTTPLFPTFEKYTVFLSFRYTLHPSSVALCTLYALSVYCSSLWEIAWGYWGLLAADPPGGGSNTCAGLDPPTLSNPPKVPQTTLPIPHSHPPYNMPISVHSQTRSPQRLRSILPSKNFPKTSHFLPV